jgi:alpha-1,6-mannosyltransferase
MSLQPRSLTFCDINTFYGPTAGGIRTYHRAKINWFASQQRHRYVVVHPGERYRVSQLAEMVTRVEVYGKPVGGGYRLLLDVRRVVDVLQALAPDIVEAGDPWISGPIGLVCREVGTIRGLLASFCHSDPVAAYLRPWAERGAPGKALMRRKAVRGVERALAAAQRMYDCTVVASASMVRQLTSAGVRRIIRAPFGVDPIFLAPRARPVERPRRLLFAGRLSPEKGVDTLLRALPAIMADPGVSLTVAGIGPYEPAFASLPYPCARYVGFRRSPAEMRRLFDEHDLLLAPGPVETFGLTALEAAASGLVVVGPDAGATGDLLREMGSPFVFEPGSPEGLAAAVRRAVAGDCSLAAEAGRRVALRYGTWTEAVGHLVRRYERALDDRWSR